jgi:transcriptional regulator with XRE-family HTH domain
MEPNHKIIKALDSIGLRIEPSASLSRSHILTALNIGRSIMDALVDSPLAIVLLDGIRRAFNPIPKRSRRAVMLRRAAGKSAIDCALFLGVEHTLIMSFERTGHGLSDLDIAALEAWLGRSSRKLASQAVANAIGVDLAAYERFETKRHPLDWSALNRLDQWLNEIVRRTMGQARYAVFPIRRLSERHQIAWDDVVRQLPNVFHRILIPLIQASMLDNVRFSLIGSNDRTLFPSLPHDLWIPSNARIPVGAPSPDILCHIWAPPDHPPIRQFFMGQWVVFAVLSRAIETARRMHVSLEFEINPLVVKAGGENGVAVPVRCDSVITVEGKPFIMESVTSRHFENQREAVRRMKTVLAPLIGSPQQVIGVLLNPPVDEERRRFVDIDDESVTLVSIHEAPSLFEDLLARHTSEQEEE